MSAGPRRRQSRKGSKPKSHRRRSIWRSRRPGRVARTIALVPFCLSLRARAWSARCETWLLCARPLKRSQRLRPNDQQDRGSLPATTYRTSRQSYPVRGKRMPLEKFLRREVWTHLLRADRFDFPHLNIFIATRPVLRPDDTACSSFARGGQHAFGSDHLVRSEPFDLVTIAKRQFHLHTPRRAVDQLVENAFDICVNARHVSPNILKRLP
jgi:hypothetical protein